MAESYNAFMYWYFLKNEGLYKLIFKCVFASLAFVWHIYFSFSLQFFLVSFKNKHFHALGLELAQTWAL